jgi:hypothetical protein
LKIEKILAINEEDKIIVFPNPTSEKIKLNLLENIDYQIFNSVGVLENKGKTTNGEIDVRQLLSGIYFIDINSKRYKFVKN